MRLFVSKPVISLYRLSENRDRVTSRVVKFCRTCQKALLPFELSIDDDFENDHSTYCCYYDYCSIIFFYTLSLATTSNNYYYYSTTTTVLL
jgi:hypothetical protein